MTDIYTLDKLDSIEAEAIRGSTAQKGIYVTPNLIRRFNGDGNTAIIFKRLLYCCEQWADGEGWFYQTAETIEQVVGLGYRAQQRSVKRLEKMGLIEKKLAGMPYKTHYRVNLSAYLELIKQESSFNTSAKTSLATRDEASPDTTGGTCLDASGEQMILNDPDSNDTKNDTYSADADFSEIFPEKQEADDPVACVIALAEGGTQPEDLQRATAAVQAEGRNYAVPPPAGGADAVAEAALTALHQAKGGSAPQQGSGTYVKEIEAIGQALRDRGIRDPDVAILAAQLFVKDKPKLACPHYKSFVGDYGEYLGKAQAKGKAQAHTASTRRARDIEATEESTAALEERKAARDPPVEDCPVGAVVKHELKQQVSPHLFKVFVAPASFVQEDGALHITAPDVYVRGWLEGNAGDTIQRILRGFADGPERVQFEVMT